MERRWISNRILCVAVYGSLLQWLSQLCSVDLTAGYYCILVCKYVIMYGRIYFHGQRSATWLVFSLTINFRTMPMNRVSIVGV